MFKAIVLEETDGKVEAALQELEDSRLPGFAGEGGVTVAIEYTTLNYKDGMVLNGIGRLVRAYPHVPGIDFAGTVEASDHPDYAPGDRVILTGWRVGESTWGGHAQKARVKGDWLVPLPEAMVNDVSVVHIEAFYKRLDAAGTLPVSIGGDHSITYPIFRAIAAERPIGMVHIDAHTDTWDEFLGSKFTHGAPFRRAVEDGLLDPKRTVQIGIRGAQNTDEGWTFSLDSGMRVIFMEEFTRIGVDAVIAEARRVVGDGPVYVSFDVDGLDPVYAPGTGTPEIGGLTTIEAQALIRGLRGLDLVGGDVVEVAPPFDPSGNTALVGATLMYEILCVLAEPVAARRKGG